MRWKRVIYCSRSTVSMEHPLNLSEILGASARSNRRDEITGVLAYAEGQLVLIDRITASRTSSAARLSRV